MFLSWTELMNTCILSIIYLWLLSSLSRFLTGQLGISSPCARQSTKIRRDVQTDQGMEFLGCGSMPGGYYEEERDMDEDFTGEVVSGQLEVVEKEECEVVVPGSSDDVGTDVGAFDAALVEPTDSTTQPLITINTLHPAPTSSLRRIITTAHLTSPRPHSSPSFPTTNPRRLSPLASFPATPSLKRTDRIKRRSPALRPSSSCNVSSSSTSSPTTSTSEDTVSPTSISSPDSSLTSSTSIIRTALDPAPFPSTTITTTPSSSTNNNVNAHRRIKSFRVRVPDIHNFDDPDPFARDSPVTTPSASIRLGFDFTQGREREREAGDAHEYGGGTLTRLGERFLDMGTGMSMGTGTGTEMGVVGRETNHSFWDESDVGEVDVNPAGGAGAGGPEEKTMTGAKMGRKVSLRVRENMAGIVSRLKRTASLNLTSNSRGREARLGRVGGRRME